MPPERVQRKQRTISWASIGTPTRQTPRRTTSTIQNYSQYERIDEPIRNPSPAPRTPKTNTQSTEPDKDGDIQMADGEDDDELDNLSSSLGEEEIAVDGVQTPTRQNVPTTITIKKRHLKKKDWKPREETTWT
jgi:hypothetical protein